MDLQLHRITRLVRDYHAVLPWKAIHIAGTNGKGTAAAYISTFLHQKGFKVGRFNSPHLKYRHDCIVLNERPVDKDLFLEVERLVKDRDAKAQLGATSFELLTATAFEIFARQKIEVAVVECGLGGRLDATNILLPEEVICCAFTSISYDHQDMLGDTLEKIAMEKAGIIKVGVPVVYEQNNQNEVIEAIKSRAVECTAPYTRCTRTSDRPLTLLDSSDPTEDRRLMSDLCVPTMIYQTIRQSGSLDLAPLSRKDLVRAIDSVRKIWKGRLQWEDFSMMLGTAIPRQCLLDGAHNAAGARRLRAYVDHIVAKKTCPVVWLLAMSSTKKEDELMAELVRDDDQVVVTGFGEVDGMPWVKPHAVENLAAAAGKKSSKAVIEQSVPSEALRAAVAAAPDDALIVIAGSLYLIGQMLRELDEIREAPSEH